MDRFLPLPDDASVPRAIPHMGSRITGKLEPDFALLTGNYSVLKGEGNGTSPPALGMKTHPF
jgi:hypothetical protein